jgi:hypothetical protein
MLRFAQTERGMARNKKTRPRATHFSVEKNAIAAAPAKKIDQVIHGLRRM